MRDFFIRSLEMILNVVVVLAFLALIVTAVAIMAGAGGEMGMGGGVLAGLGVLVVGAIYLTLIFGFMFLGLGIYQNTLKTAQQLEKLAMR